MGKGKVFKISLRLILRLILKLMIVVGGQVFLLTPTLCKGQPTPAG